MRITLVPNLSPTGGMVSVGIIDGGFRSIPRYARIHGTNPSPGHIHGNRVLGVFRSPDAKRPIPMMELHLACVGDDGGYDALLRAINFLPRCDIVSISLAWKEDRQDIREALLSKAGTIVAAYPSNSKRPYPAAWGGNVVTCSQTDNPSADFSIDPRPLYKGNSYAVPAIARLLAYGQAPRHEPGGVPVQEFFPPVAYSGDQSNTVSLPELYAKTPATCPWCHEALFDDSGMRLRSIPDRCPYCGRAL